MFIALNAFCPESARGMRNDEHMPILTFAVDHLASTVYAPLMNLLMVLLAGVIVYAAISKPLGQLGRQVIPPVRKAVCWIASKLKSRGFGPEWEATRRRIAPYVEFVSSLYFALMCLYTVVFVSLALWMAYNHHARASGWVIAFAWGWILVSLYAMRRYIEDASWHYHAIKTRRAGDR